jgi:anaerobic selenocysteine-containing dehydrogenase
MVNGACPHDCPDTCAFHVTVEDGRAVKLEGRADHPITAGFLCGKVSDYLERVYSPERIVTPLLRTGPKGAGAFRPASWDEALEAAAGGIAAAIERHGPESVLPYSYLGTMGVLQGGAMADRVMDALGASRLVRTICASAGATGVGIATGKSPEVDPEEWPHARLIVCWGWNPMSTAPHLWRLITLARRNGARLIVIDPFRSRTARVADQHLRPLPGTDGALALGILRALLDAGLADEAWCREHAVGYDDLVARLADYPVDTCAALCDVPEDDIRALARDIATVQPSLVRLGVGAQRHAGAPIAYRTVACIPALAGSWRHRGGGLSYIPRAATNALDTDVLARPALRRGTPRAINMSQLGSALTDPALAPPVAAMVVWAANPAAIAPDQTPVLRGLARDDLHLVVLEHFLTDTARYADVILPATMQLEHLDVHWSWGHHYLTLNEPAIEPVGDCLPNSEIFRRLADRLGLDDAAFRETDAAMLDEVLAAAPAAIDAAELRANGFTKIDLGQGALPHAEGGFGTPSGKLELRADGLADRGIDPLPHYHPPAEVADAALAARFPLALVTPKTHLFLNSTFANGVRQHAAQPEPRVFLHVVDAAARGIADGDVVRVSNDRGAFRCRVVVSDDARPGVVVAPMGWWNRDYADGASPQVATPQLLTDLGEAPTFNDCRVEVVPVAGA